MRLFLMAFYGSAAVFGCSGCSSQFFYISTDSITTVDDVKGGPSIKSSPSFWQSPGPNVSREGSNYYHVRLPGFARAKAEQEGPDFCWAACAQMILKFRGRSVSQKLIVEKIRGPVKDLEDRSGTALDIMNALSGPWQQVSYTNGNGTWIVMDIARNWPVIIGLKTDNPNLGHACVVTGAWLSWDGPLGQARAVIHKLEVFDPARGKGNRTITGEDLKNQLLFSVHFQSIY